MSKRILAEYKLLMSKKLPGILEVDMDEKENRLWKLKISGPTGSPYESGTFVVKYEMEEDHPFKKPKITFETQIYHPNVNLEDMTVCITVLDKWKPATNAVNVFEELIRVLEKPEFEHPANVSMVEEETTGVFAKKAKEWTIKHAGGKKN